MIEVSFEAKAVAEKFQLGTNLKFMLLFRAYSVVPVVAGNGIINYPVNLALGDRKSTRLNSSHT